MCGLIHSAERVRGIWSIVGFSDLYRVVIDLTLCPVTG